MNTKQQKNPVYFIDKFTVPAASMEEFGQRVSYNRTFIKSLPGFVDDVMYQKTEDNGDFSIITIATWETKEDLANARNAVQQEYARTNFNPVEFFKRLAVILDRGVYANMDNDK